MRLRGQGLGGWWGRLPLRIKTAAVLSLPAAALVVAAAAFWFTQRAQNEAQDAVLNTFRAIVRVAAVWIQFDQAESGMRGYLLTRDDAFLASYRSAIETIPVEIERFRSSVTQAPDQLARLAEFEELTRLHLASLDELRVGALETARWDAGAGLESLSRGREEAGALRAKLTELAVEETRVLALREAARDSVQRLFGWVVAVTAAVGLGGGFLALMASVGGITRRIERLSADAELLATGNRLGETDPGNDEIGRVGRALRQAGEQIRARDRELRESNTILEHLITSGPVVILRREVETFLVSYVSPNVERIFGWRPEEVVGVTGFWAEQVHPEDRPRFYSEWQDALAEGKPERIREYRFLHKDGGYRWLRTTARLEPAHDGKPASVLAYFSDATASKQADEDLRQAHDDAMRATQAKSEFLSRMSHELRTPLNVILGFAQLLAMENLAPAQRENVDDILKAGRHLMELIDEVLDISRVEAGRLALSIEPVHVAHAIDDVIDMIRPLAAAAKVHLTTDLPAESPLWVLADRQRLKQILLNLVSNGLKYNRPGGSIRVSADSADGAVNIRITDTGQGIPPDRLHRLFTPFDRLGAEASQHVGTGLGLTLSLRLAEAMEGGITVESAIGAGSTFTLHLPGCDPPDGVEEGPVGEGVAEPAPAPTPGALVLYIEDNPSNVKVIERVLEHRRDVELLVAPQGRLGVDLARQHRPDLILLDLNLGDVPGQDVLDALRHDPATVAIPVVVLSADATPGSIRRLLAAGAAEYLTKPLDVAAFLETVDRLLRGRSDGD